MTRVVPAETVFNLNPAMIARRSVSRVLRGAIIGVLALALPDLTVGLENEAFPVMPSDAGSVRPERPYLAVRKPPSILRADGEIGDPSSSWAIGIERGPKKDNQASRLRFFQTNALTDTALGLDDRASLMDATPTLNIGAMAPIAPAVMEFMSTPLDIIWEEPSTDYLGSAVTLQAGRADPGTGETIEVLIPVRGFEEAGRLTLPHATIEPVALILEPSSASLLAAGDASGPPGLAKNPISMSGELPIQVNASPLATTSKPTFGDLGSAGLALEVGRGVHHELLDVLAQPGIDRPFGGGPKGSVASQPFQPFLKGNPLTSRSAVGEAAAAGLEFKSQLVARVDGRVAGKFDFRQDGQTILVRLGSIVDLLEDRFAPDQFERFASAAASNSYLSIAQLNAAGVPLSYDPVYDEFNIGSKEHLPAAAHKVQIDQISASQRETGPIAIDQIVR